MLPCVPENDSEELDSVQSSDVVQDSNKDSNSKVTDTTHTTAKSHSSNSNGARLTSHKSLDSPNATDGTCSNDLMLHNKVTCDLM